MKILMIFVDMMRPNLLHTWDPEKTKTDIDCILEKWGGTSYINCYTPAPDTPRSIACLWSGMYPSRNGCNTRIKYPRYYYNEPKHTFLHMLKQNGYSFNFIMTNVAMELGEIPEEFISAENYFSKDKLYEEALSEIRIDENSLTYIGFHDYHMIVDDWDSAPNAADEANKKIGEALRMIDDTLDLEQFDLVFLYSDHGWKMSTESLLPVTNQLGDNRTKIFMHVKKKGEHGLTRSNRLCSILDVGKTICTEANIPMTYKNDGIAFSDHKNRNYVLIEDHKTFDVSLGQTIELWGIRTENGLICFDAGLNVETDREISDDIISWAKNIVMKKGSFFRENIKAQRILISHAQLIDIPTYYDGTNRVRHTSDDCYYMIPDIENLKGKRVALYGAGLVGHDYLIQLQNIDEIIICSLFDKDWKNINRRHITMNASNPDEMDTDSFDVLIVAIWNERIAKDVIKELVAKGIPREKIFWRIPQRDCV